ncbi:hypothetical protein LSAT2_000487 [Lamellibrachia satsuma]|nr:hypothetical protein LSAT2_000487 [Lamellibrachia satsuma]
MFTIHLECQAFLLAKFKTYDLDMTIFGKWRSRSFQSYQNVKGSSGNYQNQLVVFDNKVCDYINFILRGSKFHGCSDKEVLTLKKSIAMMLFALIEEDVNKCGPGAKEVCEAIDAESIWQTALESYQQASDVKESLSAELKANMLELGFRYFHILCRMRDLYPGPQVQLDRLLKMADKTTTDKDAWDFYSSGTLSIEIVKDGGLQKIHFTCMDKVCVTERTCKSTNRLICVIV